MDKYADLKEENSRLVLWIYDLLLSRHTGEEVALASDLLHVAEQLVTELERSFKARINCQFCQRRIWYGENSHWVGCLPANLVKQYRELQNKLLAPVTA